MLWTVVDERKESSLRSIIAEKGIAADQSMEYSLTRTVSAQLWPKIGSQDTAVVLGFASVSRFQRESFNLDAGWRRL